MRIFLNNLNFKGKYVVKGSKEELNQIQDILAKKKKDLSHPINVFSSMNFDTKKNSYRIFATNADAYTLEKSKKSSDFKTIFKTFEGNITDKIQQSCKIIFQTDDIAIHNAKDILNKEKQTKFNYKDGIFKGDIPNKKLNGNIDYYIDNVSYAYQQKNILKTRILPNGTQEEFYSNGSIKTRIYSDGKIKEFEYRCIIDPKKK